MGKWRQDERDKGIISQWHARTDLDKKSKEVSDTKLKGLLGGDWVCSFVWCFVGALDAVAPEPANALGSLLLKLHPGGLLRWLVSSLKRAGSSSTTIAGVTLESSAKTQIFRHYDEVDHDNAACSVCFVALAPWLLPPR
ncbi:hypothetical protein [Oryza sativa Japonica Group]|uniref:Uncharacterized protein n=2 Tax=Oryza sativa subsp. japonica TaxID=39947 RepID=A2ZW60_ORYSJ|nr:hypothetical protein OsJ_02877 [Oryza sativa Japonica Group]BAD72403.1 hypothetical protein [Oryza sativa Japonica Group]